jgi:hypothetical protein
VFSSPAEGLALLVPALAGAAAAPGARDGVLEWNLKLLAGAVRSAGGALPPYVSVLSTAIAAGFSSKAKAPKKAAGKLLRWALRALLDAYPAEARSHAAADWAAPGALWKKWAQPHGWCEPAEGSGGGLPPLAMEWVTPTPAGRAAALELVNAFLVPAMLRLRSAAERIAAAAPPAAGSSDEARAKSAPLPAAGGGGGGGGGGSESEALRSDLIVLIAGVRGAVYALPDGADGDDGVIATGTAAQALKFGAVANGPLVGAGGAAVYGGATAGVPLRQVLAANVHALMRALARHEGYAKDVDTQVLCVKAMFRLISGRGARMSKTRSALSSAKSNKGFYRDSAWAAAVRAFSKVARAVEWGAPGAQPQPLCSALHTGGGAHQLPRCGQVARVALGRARREAESIFAIPQALHFPSEAGGIVCGSGGGDEDDGDAEAEADGEGDEALFAEVKRASSSDAEAWEEEGAPPSEGSPRDARGGGASSGGGSGGGSSTSGGTPPEELAPAFYAFGRTAVGKLAPCVPRRRALLCGAPRRGHRAAQS